MSDPLNDSIGAFASTVGNLAKKSRNDKKQGEAREAVLGKDKSAKPKPKGIDASGDGQTETWDSPGVMSRDEQERRKLDRQHQAYLDEQEEEEAQKWALLNDYAVTFDDGKLAKDAQMDAMIDRMHAENNTGRYMYDDPAIMDEEPLTGQPTTLRGTVGLAPKMHGRESPPTEQQTQRDMTQQMGGAPPAERERLNRQFFGPNPYLDPAPMPQPANVNPYTGDRLEDMRVPGHDMRVIDQDPGGGPYIDQNMMVGGGIVYNPFPQVDAPVQGINRGGASRFAGNMMREEPLPGRVVGRGPLNEDIYVDENGRRYRFNGTAPNHREYLDLPNHMAGAPPEAGY